MPPQVVSIYSENNDYQHLDVLRRNRVKRLQYREFFVEGVRLINQALLHGWPVQAFLYARDQPLSDWARDILAASPARLHYELPAALLAQLSDKREPSELLAVLRMPADDLGRIPLRSDLLVVVCDRPASPGNLGTLIRSCDALGVDGVVITGHGVDLYEPECLRATAGSFFAVPAVRLGGPSDLLPWFETIQRTIGPFQLAGSSAKATVDLATWDFTGPTVLAVGNETWGLSSTYKELCDVLVRIPMQGTATSLNVACATSILLYEIDRQRRAGGL